MRLTARDKINSRIDMQQARVAHNSLMLRYPTYTNCTTCGYDTFSDSGDDPDCPECGGKGRIATWHNYQCHARISWPSLTDFALGIAGGIEMGDVILYISLQDKAQIERVKDSGYALIDNEKYGIKTINPAGLGAINECIIIASRQEQ